VLEQENQPLQQCNPRALSNALCGVKPSLSPHAPWATPNPLCREGVAHQPGHECVFLL
jgi:hypothetical protein